MKKEFQFPLFYFLLFTITALALVSCKKSPAVSNVSSFTWTCRDNTFTAGRDSAFVHSMATTAIIVAGKTGGDFFSGKQLSIAVASFNAGSYAIGGGNELEYVDDAGNLYFGIDGTVKITNYANNRLTGDFSVNVAGPAGSFPITGNFVNTAVVP